MSIKATISSKTASAVTKDRDLFRQLIAILKLDRAVLLATVRPYPSRFYGGYSLPGRLIAQISDDTIRSICVEKFVPLRSYISHWDLLGSMNSLISFLEGCVTAAVAVLSVVSN